MAEATLRLRTETGPRPPPTHAPTSPPPAADHTAPGIGTETGKETGKETEVANLRRRRCLRERGGSRATIGLVVRGAGLRSSGRAARRRRRDLSVTTATTID